jgi:hypothetical protein
MSSGRWAAQLMHTASSREGGAASHPTAGQRPPPALVDSGKQYQQQATWGDDRPDGPPLMRSASFNLMPRPVAAQHGLRQPWVEASDEEGYGGRHVHLAAPRLAQGSAEDGGGWAPQMLRSASHRGLHARPPHGRARSGRPRRARARWAPPQGSPPATSTTNPRRWRKRRCTSLEPWLQTVRDTHPRMIACSWCPRQRSGSSRPTNSCWPLHLSWSAWSDCTGPPTHRLAAPDMPLSVGPPVVQALLWLTCPTTFPA